MGNTSSSWFVCRNPRAFPKIKLFCFPYAGGGSSIYRHWDFNGDIEVHAAILPGRETRFAEMPISQMDHLVSKLAHEIREYLDTPFVFFGHSMGALIAYELAHKIQDIYGISPTHLFLSGRSAPQLENQQPSFHNMPREMFLKKLRSLGGTPMEIFENPEALELYEPLLRGDFKLCDTYNYINREPLKCPMTILGGYQDKLTSMERLEKWSELTTGTAVVKMYHGDHFFIRTQDTKLQQYIYHLLTSFLS
ncbi:thioesterase II family protein [Metabacillus halosaccharovorans]|uniref:alpha/beta fold hydrolase n=1 Tax=Metabacillus halosaccharovorans TaxID=930124 RepID=UPI00403D81C5